MSNGSPKESYMFVHRFSHANLKNGDDPTSVFVALPLIFTFYFSNAHRCTHLVATSGAVIPILEEPKAVREVLEAYYKNLGE